MITAMEPDATEIFRSGDTRHRPAPIAPDSSDGRRSPRGHTQNGVSQLLLTPEQVARALAIGRTRVYELMASGALPSIRLGRSRRVACHVLDRYVEELCTSAEEP
jgi:excisionase family DNA binding protein